MVSALGCGQIGIALVLRTAPRVVLQDLTRDVTAAQCTRRLNDISTASLTIRDCYDGPRLVPWHHALLMSWDASFLWYGPVTNVRQQADGSGQIEASDVMKWMSKRKIRTPHDYTGIPADVATIFSTLITEGFAQDPSVSISLSAAATGILAEREYGNGSPGLVYDAITELASTGIDWTVFLDEIVCGDVEIATTPIGVLTRSHFIAAPEVTLNGEAQGTFKTVVGSGGGDSATALVGLSQDAAAIAYYGLLDDIDSEPDILDQTSLDAAADTRLALEKDSPIQIGDAKLAEHAPLSVNDLLPGAIVTMNLTGNHVEYAGDVRLGDISFEASDGRWTATVGMQPVGTT